MIDKIKIVVFVPKSHADIVRKAMGEVDAGKIGNYSHCSFSVDGTGRYLPLNGAKPAIGKVGQFEEVVEERIEYLCEKSLAKKVIAAMKKVHPYEEVAFDIYPLLSEDDL